MSDVLAKIKKRRCYPVEVGGGTVHVRSLTRGELDRVGKLEGSAQTAFVVGCVLVDADGSPALPKLPNETDEAYASRLLLETEDVDSETVAAITAAVGKIGKAPTLETLAKN